MRRAIAVATATREGCWRAIRQLVAHGARVARLCSRALAAVVQAMAAAVRRAVVAIAHQLHRVLSRGQRVVLAVVLAVQLAVSEVVSIAWHHVSEVMRVLWRALSRVVVAAGGVAARAFDAASSATLRAARALGHAVASAVATVWRRAARPALNLLSERILQPLALLCGRQWPVVAAASSCFSVQSFARAGCVAAGNGDVRGVLPALLGAGVSLSVSLLLSGLVLGLPTLQARRAQFCPSPHAN